LKYVSLGLGVVLVLSLGLDTWSHRSVDQFSFIQVGQGDCAVFRENGVTVMVDAGPRQGSFSAGQRLVWPALRNMGIDRINCLVISHPDMDHIGGLAAIAERVVIDEVVVAEAFRDHPVLVEELALAKIPPQKMRYMDSNTRLKFGEMNVTFYPAPLIVKDDNDGSLLTVVETRGTSIALSGDASAEIERFWIQQGVPKCEIVKAGHHGSEHSLSREWMEFHQPKQVIFSSGRNNTFGHRGSGTISRCRTTPH